MHARVRVIYRDLQSLQSLIPAIWAADLQLFSDRCQCRRQGWVAAASVQSLSHLSWQSRRAALDRLVSRNTHFR